MSKSELIPVIRLTQWLDAWNEYEFEAAEQRRKPEPFIYLFSMAANRLRQLSDVYRRDRSVTATEGIQRDREKGRTARIRRYIEAGYPFGDLRESDQKRNPQLRKPGWIPTAIVINILTLSDSRRGKNIAGNHVADVVEENGFHHLRLPAEDDFSLGDLRPFEVIDGQHRLWAFDDSQGLGQFELPVVAFHGLDVAWQAYLFWSINISPVRINPSHAFDLYPLLRNQDWLEKTGEINVYRTARAQEITEWLYRLPSSPWHDRISMLQRRGEPRVSQAAWVRSLIGSFFSTGRGKGRRGLFQAVYDGEGLTLEWERVQQIAFIVEFWHLLRKCVEGGSDEWITLYRKQDADAFTDRTSMLNQDMGVRAVHAVLNDLFFSRVNTWGLPEWTFSIPDKTTTTGEEIENAVSSLRDSGVHPHLQETASALARFDWRSVEGPGVKSSAVEMTKRAYRGSGGYTLLTTNVVQHVLEHGEHSIADAAQRLVERS